MKLFRVSLSTVLLIFCSRGRENSHHLLLTELPIAFINSNCSSSQMSMVNERILETCVPIFLCTPTHWSHTISPKLIEAHSGFSQLQSAQKLLASESFWISFKKFRLNIFNLFFCCSSNLNLMDFSITFTQSFNSDSIVVAISNCKPRGFSKLGGEMS